MENGRMGNGRMENGNEAARGLYGCSPPSSFWPGPLATSFLSSFSFSLENMHAQSYI